MPYKTTSRWVKPKFLCRHRGISVYYTYTDNELDQGESSHLFTTDPSEESTGERVFNVTRLSTWKYPVQPPFISGLKGAALRKINAQWKKYNDDKVEEKAIKAAIKAAIEKGEIK